jgi:transposase
VSENITTIGIDIGDRYCQLAVLHDETGDLLEQTRVRSTPRGLEAAFRSRPRARVVLEAGTHSGWMSPLLVEWGHELFVANPRKVRACVGSKSDRLDAEFLARLGRADPKLLHPVRLRSEKTQVALSVIRSRDALVSARTKLVNHVRALVKNVGERLPKRTAASFHKVVDSLPEVLRPALESVMECIAQLTARIRVYDRRIERMCEDEYPETVALRQVHGVGPITALTFVLTLETPTRFHGGRAVGAYLGLCPRRRQSGETDPQLRITKAGSPLLRRLLVGAAHYILGPFGPDTDLRRWGLGLTARGGKNAKKRAAVAVARRLATLLFSLWQTGEVYEPLRLAVKENA